MTIYSTYFPALSSHEVIRSASMDHVLTRAAGLLIKEPNHSCLDGLYEVLAVRPNAIFVQRRSTGTIFEITS